MNTLSLMRFQPQALFSLLLHEADALILVLATKENTYAKTKSKT